MQSDHDSYPFPKQALNIFMCLQYKSFQNSVGGEIARNK